MTNQSYIFFDIEKLRRVNRLFFVRLIVSLGLISGLLNSYNLWYNSRFYPLVPAAEFIPILAPPFDLLLYISILILLVIIIFYPKEFIFSSLFILIFYLILQDQSRLQPWFYQYIFLLGTIAWFQYKPNPNRHRSAVIICQAILIGIYLWSGIHKLNYSYLHETFEWMTGPAFEIFPFLESLSLPALATLSAITEIGAALSLAFQSTRKYGAGILIAMHILILLMIGPLGLNHNSIIWPWNICFILLLVVLFIKPNIKVSVAQQYMPRSFYHSIVIILFLVIPLLNFFNLWDHFLSASLYSGKKPYAKVHITGPVKKQFPEVVLSEFNLLNELSVRDWSYAELNTPEYPQPRIYKQIFRQLCDHQKQKFGLVLEIYNTADLLTGKRTKEEYFCHEL